MPLPLLVAEVVTTIVTGAAGAAAAVSASNKNSQSREINKEARNLIESAKRELDKERRQTNSRLERFGRAKLLVIRKEIKRFLTAFSKIHNISMADNAALNEFGLASDPVQSVSDLSRVESLASSIAGGAMAGAACGALTAFGAYSVTGILATASSGTAIASLSGAAATNATLAFLGGGSLAAGGLGVAGGTFVLGGLVAGPALLVMGLVSSFKASANLDIARSNMAEAQKIAEQLKTASQQCIAISRKTDMFIQLLERAVEYFSPLLRSLKTTVMRFGTDYEKYSDRAKKKICAAYSMAMTVRAIIDTPILTETGAINPECDEVLGKVGSALPKR